MNSENQKIALIGLGYVGLPLAVEFGKVRPVLGFDINDARIAELRAGKDSTLEVTPDDLAEATQLEYSSDRSKLTDCSIFIITVPTPIDTANRPDLTPVIKASETVGKAMKVGAIVIYESTVYPGCTEEVCVPILERESGLKFNEGFFCGYSRMKWLTRLMTSTRASSRPEPGKPAASKWLRLQKSSKTVSVTLTSRSSTNSQSFLIG